MATGKERYEWSHTALLAAQLANWTRDADTHPQAYNGWDFYPFTKDGKRKKQHETATAPKKPKMKMADLQAAMEGGLMRKQ